MEQMAALSFNQSDAGRGIGRQGRGQFQPPAPFTPTGFGQGGQAAPTGFGRGDKDEDVDGDAVDALLVLLPDGDPPSQQSQQDGYQGTR
jgi:hypothetical protein